MPRKRIEIDEPSYLCPDCGKQIDFFEGTIWGMKKDSMKRPQILAESGPEEDEHQLVFERGEMVRILCPKKPKAARKASPKRQR